MFCCFGDLTPPCSVLSLLQIASQEIKNCCDESEKRLRRHVQKIKQFIEPQHPKNAIRQPHEGGCRAIIRQWCLPERNTEVHRKGRGSWMVKANPASSSMAGSLQSVCPQEEKILHCFCFFYFSFLKFKPNNNKKPLFAWIWLLPEFFAAFLVWLIDYLLFAIMLIYSAVPYLDFSFMFNLSHFFPQTYWMTPSSMKTTMRWW